MSFFGLTDPWIVASYIGCFVSAALCCYIGFKVRKSALEDEEHE
ncbi:hypothetical protein TALC_00891 [Thermoplasmatales archaeon BRNA1]|nr:hypothetical protein TALC_00891 [Thermoplasmatales archaeon BRNA1]